MKKTNRTFKRFAAITSASLLAACAVAPVFTSMTSYAATEFTLTAPTTLPADSTITNIKAYKIFNCEITQSGAFNVVSWATDVTPELLGFAAGTEAADAAVAINASGYDVEALAKKAATALTKNAISAASYANNKVTFESDLAVGYYVVVCDVKNSNDTEYDAKSLGMLTVTGRNGDTEIGETGQAKVGLPTVEKKVKENVKDVNGTPINDPDTEEKWNDVADYNIGDPVPFKLYGTLPADLDKYSAYYYCFNDTLAPQFDMPSKDNVIVKINGNPVTQGKNLRVEIDGRNISVSFEDIKAAGAEYGDIVTVEYEAVLNQTAEIGLNGQENKVDLTYSNNPNWNYAPDLEGDSKDTVTGDDVGTTPEDKVIVFTYELDVTKKFLNAAGNEISNPSDVANITFNLSNGKSNITFIKVGDYYYPSTETGSSADLKLDANNKILIKGLDAATYTLIEAVGPSGFNKADDTDITITATTVNNQTWSGTAADALTSFKYTVEGEEEVTGDVNTAIAAATIENRQGTSLPGTGGIGTTIFYLGGGAMAAIGGVYLISKRRMKKSEE